MAYKYEIGDTVYQLGNKPTLTVINRSENYGANVYELSDGTTLLEKFIIENDKHNETRMRNDK